MFLTHFSGEHGQLTTLSPFALAVAPRPTRAAGPGTCGAGVVSGVPGRGVCGPAGLAPQPFGYHDWRRGLQVVYGQRFDEGGIRSWSFVGRSDGQPDSSGHVMRGAPVGCQCYLGTRMVYNGLMVSDSPRRESEWPRRDFTVHRAAKKWPGTLNIRVAYVVAY